MKSQPFIAIQNRHSGDLPPENNFSPNHAFTPVHVNSAYSLCDLSTAARFESVHVQEAHDVEAVQLDGSTAYGTAGTGAEFESPVCYFTRRGCSLEATNAAKKQIVAQRTGTNWELAADLTSDPEKLNAEHTLDGRNIKVGSGDGAAAVKAWVDELVSATATPPRVLAC